MAIEEACFVDQASLQFGLLSVGYRQIIALALPPSGPVKTVPSYRIRLLQREGPLDKL